MAAVLMARYVVGFIFTEEVGQLAQPVQMTVHESDPSPAETGLVTSDGRPIYRVRESVPMGYHHGRVKA